MDIQKNSFLSIEQVQDKILNRPNPSTNKETVTTSSFKDILQAKSSFGLDSEIKFSKHASMRLMDRNISLSPEQMDRLTDGTKKAQEKGIKESLVLLDSLAFIVNVPSKTVVTALDKSETSENVFTNIDGAVII